MRRSDRPAQPPAQPPTPEKAVQIRAGLEKAVGMLCLLVEATLEGTDLQQWEPYGCADIRRGAFNIGKGVRVILKRLDGAPAPAKKSYKRSQE